MAALVPVRPTAVIRRILVPNSASVATAPSSGLARVVIGWADMSWMRPVQRSATVLVPPVPVPDPAAPVVPAGAPATPVVPPLPVVPATPVVPPLPPAAPATPVVPPLPPAAPPR